MWGWVGEGKGASFGEGVWMRGRDSRGGTTGGCVEGSGMVGLLLKVIKA